MREYIAVSACLLGVNSKFNGSNNYNKKIEELIKDKTVLPICPEVIGGLTTPRNPSEIQANGTIIQNNKNDVTKEFFLGAMRTLEFLKNHNCYTVVLKNGSPSCGKYTYDGSFSHKKVDRMGVTAKLLKDNNFKLIYID